MATPSTASHRMLRPEEETRDWANLPRDALLCVLGRLSQADVLMGAGPVCAPWRRAASDEPELWRRVDLRGHGVDLSSGVEIHGMARAAVARAAGRCEAFWSEGAGHDDFLVFLSNAAPSLKSLRLISCQKVSDRVFSWVVAKFTMLEELELSLCVGSFEDVCKTTGKACPLLKSFRLSNHEFYNYKHSIIMRDVDDREAMGIATMCGLRSLQLFANRLGNHGMVSILDGCTHLDSLDIRHCFNIKMDDAMREKLSRIKMVRLPDDSMDDYDLSFEYPNTKSPIMVDFEFSSY